MRVYRSEYGGFFRLWRDGPGISWTKKPPLFSERNGYNKPLFRAFGYRFFKVGSG
jgi:hypothetical protein